MLERALECREAYCSVLLDDDLSEFILEEKEWRHLISLKEILQSFDQLTTKVCASKSYVTITMTVIVYNSLMGIIEKFIEDNKECHPDICRGADAAYKKLSQYYAATDNSPIYSVATAIHPAMRFQYWADQRWGSKYEKLAKKTVREVWKIHYVVTTDESPPQPISGINEDNFELSLLGFSEGARGDELESFVSSPITRETPLMYWKKNSDSQLQLARMARDYLSIPATSASSEQCFSKAWCLLPYTRNRLSPQRIKEQMLLNSWFDYIS
jgi:hypothetical protein